MPTLGNEVFEQHFYQLSQQRHFLPCTIPEGSIFCVYSSSAYYFSQRNLLHTQPYFFMIQSNIFPYTAKISQIVHVLQAVPIYIVYCMNYKVLYQAKPHVSLVAALLKLKQMIPSYSTSLIYTTSCAERITRISHCCLQVKNLLMLY